MRLGEARWGEVWLGLALLGEVVFRWVRRGVAWSCLVR